MLNYVVDPRLITPLVPAETEIDFENGETFLSVVGFLFLDTRLLGLPIPLHRDFQEVNQSALENLECHQLRIQRRRCGTLRRSVRRSIKSATALRVHCRRLPNYRPETSDSSVAAVCLGRRSLGVGD